MTEGKTIRHRMCFAVLFTFCATIVGQQALAQPKKTPAAKEPAKKPVANPAKKQLPAAKDEKSKPVDPKAQKALAEWDHWDEQRRQVGRKIRDLQAEFKISSRKRKEEIRKLVETEIKRWDDEIEPKLRAVAVEKLQADPPNKLAAALVGARITKGEHGDRMLSALEGIIKQKQETAGVLALASEVNFLRNNFDRALELDKKAREKGGDSRIPQSVLESYVQAWKKELALRAKENGAPQAMRLPRVKIETSRGDIILVLFENEAPNTVANFISLVEKGFYDGQYVHRVEPGFVVQAGDPDTKKEFSKKKRYGYGGPGYMIKSEFAREGARQHFLGSVSMANSGPNTGGSQFFIALKPTYDLNGRHTVFGYVAQGMNVVEQMEVGDKIIKMTVLEKRNHDYVPYTSLNPEPRKPIEAPKPKQKAKPFPKPGEKKKAKP